MAAPKGNNYYTLRAVDGRPKIFETPEDFANACEEYFVWCQENPILEDQVFSTKLGLQHDRIEKVRAFTQAGLCMYLNISIQTFDDYSKRKDFIEVVTRVRNVIYAQKFENAAAGQLNANIIARDLGLADKKEEKIELDTTKIKWGKNEVDV